MDNNIHTSDLYAQPLDYWQAELLSMTEDQLKKMHKEISLEILRRKLRYLDRDTLNQLHRMSNQIMKTRGLKG
jgi:hypothetical protein